VATGKLALDIFIIMGFFIINKKPKETHKMLGLLKKLFGGKPAEAAPYKVETPTAEAAPQPAVAVEGAGAVEVVAEKPAKPAKAKKAPAAKKPAAPKAKKPRKPKAKPQA
jgi:hypothetical protein